MCPLIGRGWNLAAPGGRQRLLAAALQVGRRGRGVGGLMRRALSARRTMPRPALTEEEQKKAREAASTELAYLLARQQVSEENQLIFYHVGVTTIEKFASLAKDREDLIEVLRTHWELDQGRSLEERVQIASIICA